MSQQINLFNPVFLKQKKYFSVLTMLQALALIVIGSLLFYGFAWYQVKMLSKQTHEMTARFVEEQTKLAKFSGEFSPQRASQLLSEELKTLETKVAAQEAMLNSLNSGAIGNTKGYSEYLRAFARQAVSGLWLTGFEIIGDGSQMSLHGAATSPQLLPAYIQRMNREEVMRGKTFAMLQMSQPKSEEGATPGNSIISAFVAQKNQPKNEAAKPPQRSYVEFSLHSTVAKEGVKP